MNLRLKHLLSKQTLTTLSRLNSRSPALASSTTILTANGGKPTSSPPFQRLSNTHFFKSFHSSPHLKFSLSTVEPTPTQTHDSDEEDEAVMNDFLSRFVHRMRGRLHEAYPLSDKPTIDAMLLVIVDKLVGQMEKGASLEEMMMSKEDLSEDLWKTVWEVSNEVYAEMEREKKKEKMKKFLQSEQVKTLTRFASEVGVRGDMLRELRFKWAREALEESEFYEGLEKYREKEKEEEEVEGEAEEGQMVAQSAEEGGRSGGLPKRHGKIKYKLYGLDLSGPQWKDVADKIHEAGEVFFPEEAKPITGKCKLVTEKILAMSKDDAFRPLLSEWVEMLHPSRVDWVSLLEKLKEKDSSLYLKVAEHVLDEPSFLADFQDYFRLLDIHAKEKRLEDVERILKKMSEKGFALDTLTLTSLVQMYSKVGNLERAKEAFELLRSLGFKLDREIYSCMIMAYVNADKPKLGEGIMREMEATNIKPSEDIYMALLRAFARHGDAVGAQRIVNTMQFATLDLTADRLELTPESYTLLVEACARSGNYIEARSYFDSMRRLGHKLDDRCVSFMVSAYEKKNQLDRALHLLLQLEKEGFEPGIATYSVLVDWLGKLLLVDEVEQMLEKIARLGEAPPLKIQVSLCEMYARAGMEKKALQTLGVLEAKKDLLAQEDFERIIEGLIKSNFLQEAQRISNLMESQGFMASESLKVSLTATKAFRGGGTSSRPGKR